MLPRHRPTMNFLSLPSARCIWKRKVPVHRGVQIYIRTLTQEISVRASWTVARVPHPPTLDRAAISEQNEEDALELPTRQLVVPRNSTHQSAIEVTVSTCSDDYIATTDPERLERGTRYLEMRSG